MKRGKPFEPGNKFGRGRPKGSRNKKTVLAQRLFEDNSPAIMAMAINKCREDPSLPKMLASHAVPRQKEAPVKIGRLPMNTLQDLDRASGAVLRKAVAGKISLNEAKQMCGLIEDRRRLLLEIEMERRLRVVENTLAENPAFQTASS